MKLAILTTTFSIGTFLLGCTNGQSKTQPLTGQQPQPQLQPMPLTQQSQQKPSMDYYHFSLETAHPNAQVLMKEDFYWSPIEEAAPFGSDDGSDAAYGFREWRLIYPGSSPVNYLNELVRRWHYPLFDFNELDSAKIKEYMDRKPDLDEATIQQRMEMMREINSNSQDGSIKMDDKQLRESVMEVSNGMNTRYLQGMDDAIVGIGFAQFVLEGHIDKDIKKLTVTAIKRELLPVMLIHNVEGYRDRRKAILTKMLDVINKAKEE